MIPFALEVDAVGLNCPMPLLKLKKALNTLNSEDVVKIAVSDNAAHLDFGVFCEQAAHEILTVVEKDNFQIFYIKKG